MRNAFVVTLSLRNEQNMLCLSGALFGPGQDKFLRLYFVNVEADRIGEFASRLVASQTVF